MCGSDMEFLDRERPKSPVFPWIAIFMTQSSDVKFANPSVTKLDPT